MVFERLWNSVRNWKNAVKVPEERKQLWVNETILHLKNHPEEEFYYVTSGDTMVVGFRRSSKENRIEVYKTVIKKIYEA